MLFMHELCSKFGTCCRCIEEKDISTTWSRGRHIVYSSEDDDEKVNHKRVKSAAGSFYYNSTTFSLYFKGISSNLSYIHEIS